MPESISQDLTSQEALQLAGEALIAGEIALAERYFLRALRIADYDGAKADARGQYLAYLMSHGQVERAVSLAEGWIRDSAGVQLHGFLMRLLDQPPAELKPHLRRLKLERHVHPWLLMNLSQDLSQGGRFRPAIYLMKRLIRWCHKSGDRENGWRAMGQLGRVYEDAGMDDKAEAVWSEAFWEGSSNRVLARRYTWYLERKNRHQECLRVVEEALRRIRDPEIVELLYRRRLRLLRRID